MCNKTVKRVQRARAKKKTAGTGDLYEVEAIRSIRQRQGKLEYLIKWLGWPETSNTWEPHENLVSCDHVLKDFERLQGIHRVKHCTKESAKQLRKVSALVPHVNEDHQNDIKKRLRSFSPRPADDNFGIVKIEHGFKRSVRQALAARRQKDCAKIVPVARDEGSRDVKFTQILKAVSYTTTVKDGKRDIKVLFKAVRSDGLEVLVDNKFLRASDPLLLVDYYEQRLKHGQP